MNQQKEKSGSGTTFAEPPKEKAVESFAEPFKEKEKGGGVGEVIKDAATTVGKAGSYVGQKADDATMAVGKGIKSLGNTIREDGPQEGVLGSASSSVAATLESSGKYLQQHGLSGIGEDIAETIRKHPMPAVLIGIGLGYLLGRVLRS
jgi:hypothetical protein